jgi:hypothetical protein
LAFFAALSFLATDSRAATLVSNMSNTPNGNLSPQSTFWMAQKFTTDASAWTLGSIQFRGARNASQTLAVSIYSHDGVNDLPSASIGTFDASGVTTTVGAQTLPANGTINLAASTSYWIVIAPSDVNTALWTQSTDLTNTGPGTIPNRRAVSANSGGTWSALAAGNNLLIQVDSAAPDTTPDAFAFVDQTNVPPSTTITSAPITVSGINAPSPISVAGGLYSVNGGGFTGVAGNVNNGDAVRAQHTSSASFSTAVNTTVTIGGVSDTFTSTTLAADTTPDAFAFVDQTNVPPSTTITSAPITVSGINAPSPISVTGGLYSINGGGFTGVAANVNNGDLVRAQHTSSASFSTAVNTTVTIGGVSDTFTSTTLAAPAAAAEVPALGGWAAVALAGLLAAAGVTAVRRFTAG